MPLISIVIPVYNIKDYLKDCIDSILDQNYKRIEIILVNDGSTDGSQNICDNYSKRYSQIKLINKENGGLSDARNTGLMNAEGEYILFVDGDDFLEKNTLVDLAEFTLQKKKPDMILYNYAKYYQKRKKYKISDRSINPEILNKKSEESILEYLLKNDNNFNWIVCQCMYKKDLLIQNDLFFEKGRLYEDILWLPNVLAGAKRVEYFNETVYIYRLEREGQITSTVTKKSLIDNIYVPVHWLRRLNKLGVKEELNNLLMNNFTVRYYYSIWFSGFIEFNERQKVFELLEKYKGLLKYSKGAVPKVTRALVKFIGFKNTSLIFKSAITLKRKIANY